jgi:uncharacterized membrane protein
MDFKDIISWITRNPGRVLGAVAGFVVGVLLFTIGPAKTIVILVLTLAGYLIGRFRDDGRPLSDQIHDLFNRKR